MNPLDWASFDELTYADTFIHSDQVSDAVLDACLAEDPLSKVLPAILIPYLHSVKMTA